MSAFISFELDHTTARLNRTSLEGDADEVRKIAQQLEHTNEIWCDFSMNNGGVIIFLAGPEGRFSLPPDKLDELPTMVRRYADANEDTLSVGVGMDLQQSVKALLASKLLGGDRTTMYSDDVEVVLKEHKDGKLAKSELQMNPAPAVVDRFHNMAQAYQQAQIAKEQEMTRQNEVEQLKAQVVQVLQQLKASAPQLAELRTTSPETYQSIAMMAQAMLSLAQELTGVRMVQPQQQSQPQQSQTSSNVAIPTYAAPKAPHSVIPVGAIRNGKIKVKVGDVTSWRSVRSGLGVDTDGNPTSIRNLGD